MGKASQRYQDLKNMATEAPYKRRLHTVRTKTMGDTNDGKLPRSRNSYPANLSYALWRSQSQGERNSHKKRTGLCDVEFLGLILKRTITKQRKSILTILWNFELNFFQKKLTTTEKIISIIHEILSFFITVFFSNQKFPVVFVQ